MTRTTPTLHLLCGKVASGKSTLAARLGQEAGTVVMSEDRWLATLFGDRMHSLQDYVEASARLRAAMGAHVVELLATGVSVVLDFPANTRETRDWMRGIGEKAGLRPVLYFLDLPDETCKARLRARNASGSHPFSVTEAQFDRLARHFVPPTANEGFEIRRHDAP